MPTAFALEAAIIFRQHPFRSSLPSRGREVERSRFPSHVPVSALHGLALLAGTLVVVLVLVVIILVGALLLLSIVVCSILMVAIIGVAVVGIIVVVAARTNDGRQLPVAFVRQHRARAARVAAHSRFIVVAVSALRLLTVSRLLLVVVRLLVVVVIIRIPALRMLAVAAAVVVLTWLRMARHLGLFNDSCRSLFTCRENAPSAASSPAEG